MRRDFLVCSICRWVTWTWWCRRTSWTRTRRATWWCRRAAPSNWIVARAATRRRTCCGDARTTPRSWSASRAASKPKVSQVAVIQIAPLPGPIRTSPRHTLYTFLLTAKSAVLGLFKYLLPSGYCCRRRRRRRALSPGINDPDAIQIAPLRRLLNIFPVGFSSANICLGFLSSRSIICVTRSLFLLAEATLLLCWLRALKNEFFKVIKWGNKTQMLRIPLNFSKITIKQTLSPPTHFTCINFGGNIYEKWSRTN